jgi:hypothetical protein
VEIHEPKEMLEQEGEFDIDKEEIEDDQDDDETQLKIIDDTMDYFDQNLCVVHPHEESFEEIEIHQPTTPTPGPMNAWCPKCGDVFSSEEIFELHTCGSDMEDNIEENENDPPPTPTSSSASSTPFHGFDNVAYPDSYEKDDTRDERLQEFNNNSLQIFAVSKVSISPYTESSVWVKLNPTTSREITSLSQVDGQMILTGGLSPYPQVQDGVYQVTNSSLTITIRNNSNEDMIIHKNEIIRGVDVHSWKFVKRIMLEREGNSTDIDHFNFNQWHFEAKAFKLMNDEGKKFEHLRTNNQWVINDED